MVLKLLKNYLLRFLKCNFLVSVGLGGNLGICMFSNVIWGSVSWMVCIAQSSVPSICHLS